jgi:hypothetical protein
MCSPRLSSVSTEPREVSGVSDLNLVCIPYGVAKLGPEVYN